MLITEAKIYDENDKLIDEMPDLPVPLEPSTPFNYQKLLVGQPKASSFSVTIYDPNTSQKSNYQWIFKSTSINSLLSSAAKNYIESLSNTFKRIKYSVKFEVLCSETALIAYERITHIDQDPEFVKVPLNIANTSGSMIIFVKNLIGKTRCVYVSPQDTGLDLKLKIEDIEGISPDV